MNTKVVIVWIVAVIIFAAIGLFGMANQHLLDEPDPAPVAPGTNNNSKTHQVSCTATAANGNSSYSFTIDDATSTITNVAITYQATVQVDSIYASASNLASSSINGITMNLSGEANNFVLLMNVNPASYDQAALANYQSDLTNVFAVVQNTTDVEAYKMAINGNGNVYNCN